jgi:hypothetical protein
MAALARPLSRPFPPFGQRPLSAQLRRPGPRSATAALRRHRTVAGEPRRDMAKLFVPHRRSGPSLHAEVITSAWVCGATDFNWLSYAKDTCESSSLSPRTGHGNYRIRPRQHGRADARRADRSAQGGGSGADLSRDGKRGESRTQGAGARAEMSSSALLTRLRSLRRRAKARASATTSPTCPAMAAWACGGAGAD